ncbi:MAG: hypothetical protein AB7O24_01665 [Kofleriaceae bacterium]
MSLLAIACVDQGSGDPPVDDVQQPVVAPYQGGPISVYKSGSTFYAKNFDGTVIASGAVPDPVITAAMQYSGAINIQYASGGYPLSTSFAGFDVATDQRITLDPNVQIIVPNGYTGAVFRFFDGTRRAFLIGGTIIEAGTPQNLWTGIRFQSASSGVLFNTVRDIQVRGAKTGIHLLTQGTAAWINGNTFDGVVLYGDVVGVQFERQPPLRAGYDANQNLFNNILGQATDVTTQGVKDISGDGNQFINFRMWDMQPGDISANLTATATDTIIIGGIMTNEGFSDLGARTKIIDDWQSVKFPSAKIDGEPTAMLEINAKPATDSTVANAGLRLSNREAGGGKHSWIIYQGAVGGGSGTVPNGLDIWEYGGAGCAGGICKSRFQIKPATGDTILVPNGGNVGLGTLTPTNRLGVVGNIAATGTIVGGVGSPDLAENITASDATIEAADVVAADPRGGERVVRSRRAYDSTVLGVISTKPGILTNAQRSDVDASVSPDPSQRPIALAGRVPVKVTLEGGPIAPGDLLTTSSTPGHAMRAVEPWRGGLIGTALTSFAGGKDGSVIVFLRVQAAPTMPASVDTEIQQLRDELRALRADRKPGLHARN